MNRGYLTGSSHKSDDRRTLSRLVARPWSRDPASEWLLNPVAYFCRSYEICEVCFWEDEEIQLEDTDYDGGANKVSLRQAQKNYQQFGACEEDMIPNVRPAAIDEPIDPA